MARLVVDRGLQLVGERASGVSGASTTIQSMCVDSGSTAFAAADVTIAASTFDFNAFDATPTRSGQTISHVATFSTSEANFTIRRISLHNVAAGSGSSNSTSLVAGVDGQAISKTTSFSLSLTLDLSFTSS